MRIHIEYSDDSMWGDSDPEEMGADKKRSYERFEELLIIRFAQLYPRADITFATGLTNRISTDDITDPDRIENIKYVVDKIWGDFDWVV